MTTPGIGHFVFALIGGTCTTMGLMQMVLFQRQIFISKMLLLLPMALGIGRGADLRAPLAIAVIGGLILATLLTLIVVPVVYAVVESVRERMGGAAPVDPAGDTLVASGAD